MGTQQSKWPERAAAATIAIGVLWVVWRTWFDVGVQRAVPTTPVATAAIVPVASAAPVENDPLRTVTSARFNGKRLSMCEEITGKSSKWATQLPKLREQIAGTHDGGSPEYLGEDKLCADMFTGIDPLATCVEPHYVQRIYDSERLSSGLDMKRCLERGGKWTAEPPGSILYERQQGR